MNKKIMTALLATTSIMIAKPYAGLKIGYSKTQMNTKFSGHDYDAGAAVTHPEFQKSQKMNVSSMTFGLLLGTTFQINDKTSLFIEGDYEYLGGKTKKEHLDMMDIPGNALTDENIIIRAKNSFGFMPGVTFAFNDKMSGLFGLRLNMTQFHVRVFHTSLNNVNNPRHEKSKSKFLFGVEPTLGAAYKISDKIGARLTVGYNFMQSKKVVKDYIETTVGGADIDPGVTIKPRGVNVRVAMTYSF